MFKGLLVITSVFFLVSCVSPTPYQNVSKTQHHGFVVDKLTTTKYRIVFHGNEDTSQVRADDFALLKSAQTTIDNGFNYFILKRVRSETTSKRYVHDRDHYETIKYIGKDGTMIYTNDYATQFGSYERRFAISRPRVLTVIEFIEDNYDQDIEIFVARDIVQSLTKKYEIDF